MALKVKIQSNQSSHTIELDDRLFELLDWQANQEVYVQVQGNQLLLSPTLQVQINTQMQELREDSLPPPLPPANESSELEHYWNMARDRQEREKFMNTVRPYLKVKYGYDYSEIVCEEKAKILCRKYYMAQERGEAFTTPFWAAIES